MKRIMLLLAAGIMSVAIAACGKAAEDTSTAGTEIVENTTENSESQPVVTEAPVSETQPEGTDVSASETQPEETGTVTEETGTAADEDQTGTTETANKYVVGNVDNFDVDSKIVAAFGKEIKTVVADKDIEALADLLSFPLYMGFSDGGVSIESRDDFIALGADRIFTQELVDAMANADENSLSPSRAGFSLTDEGRPNIVFGVVNGRLAIQGMNY